MADARSESDSRMASTLSSWASLINEQVFTISSVGLRRVVGDLDAVLGQRAQHDLGIDHVLGAAQGDHADANGALLFVVSHKTAANYDSPRQSARGSLVFTGGRNLRKDGGHETSLDDTES